MSLVVSPVTVTLRPRCVAWLLLLLIAVPFTAPFSTCDLSALIGAPDQGSLMWSSPDAAGASMEAATPQAAAGSILEEERFKDGTLAVDVVIAPVSPHSEAAPLRVTRAAAVRSTLVALRL
jgi:hypothetical protein